MRNSSDPIEYLKQEVAPTRQLLFDNGLHSRLQTLPELRRFMEHHVFAVWDFTSLLKCLQQKLSCGPTANAATQRFINEIALEEEAVPDGQGRPTSHFELYVRAMDECGADTAPILRLVAAVGAGRTIAQALNAAQTPDSVRQFVETTFSIIHSGQPHAMAAAFTFGRQDLMLTMFRQWVSKLRGQWPGQLDTFVHYLDRHLQLAEKVRVSLAQQMVRELCADEPERWLECQRVAMQCLEARLMLWDGIKPGNARRTLV